MSDLSAVAGTGAIRAEISGTVTGQVAVGNNIVQNTVEHGGVIYMAAPGEVPQPVPRSRPVRLTGRAPAMFVGRHREADAALSALTESGAVLFHARTGIGKTTLLKHVALRPPREARDGVLYHRVGRQSVGDAAQVVFEAFYETPLPFKPTDPQLRHYLQPLRALVVLDDVSFDRAAVAWMMDILPEGMFLLASEERLVWEGRTLPLRSLPPDDALELFARTVGRDLGSAEEDDAARAIVRALEGQPGQIVQAARLLDTLNLELAALADRLEGGSPDMALAEELIDTLSPEERELLVTLASLPDAPLHTTHLVALTGLPDAQSILDALVHRGLLQAHSPRYTLAVAPPTGIAPLAPAQILERLSSWARDARDPDEVASQAEVVVAALHEGKRAGEWPRVLDLARAAESKLLLGRRWGAWKEALEAELGAATALSDRTAEAHALHQLGTRAVCLGDTAAGRELLLRALSLREILGEVAGTAATRHNLDLTESRRRPPLGWWRWVIPGIIVLLLLPAIWRLLSPAPPPQVIALDDGSMSISATSLDFGAVRVGSTSPVKRVIATNSSRLPVSLGDVDLSGNDFQLLRDECGARTLAPQASCSLSLAFRPTREGGRSAQLIIGVDGGDKTVALIGEGVRDGGGRGALTVRPARIDFGAHAVASTSRARRFVVVNSSRSRTGGRVEITALDIAGADPKDFLLRQDGCTRAVLAPSEACRVSIAFSPRAEGGRSASAVVRSANGSATVALAGTGGRNPDPDGLFLSVSPRALDFGDGSVGRRGATRIVRVTAGGTASAGSLTLSEVGLSGGDESDFDVGGGADPCRVGTGLGAGDTCSIAVTFTPHAVARRSASLVVEGDAGEESVVALAGKGHGAAGGVAIAYGIRARYGVRLGPTPRARAAAAAPQKGDRRMGYAGTAPARPVSASSLAVEALVSTADHVEARSEEVMEAVSRRRLPTRWSARSLAVSQETRASSPRVVAAWVQSEAVATCSEEGPAFATAAIFSRVTIAGQELRPEEIEPNTVAFDDGTTRVVLWETNWDPATGGTTNGSRRVFVNAIRHSGPGAREVVVAHAEAEVACAMDEIADLGDPVQPDGEDRLDELRPVEPALARSLPRSASWAGTLPNPPSVGFLVFRMVTQAASPHQVGDARRESCRRGFATRLDRPQPALEREQMGNRAGFSTRRNCRDAGRHLRFSLRGAG